MACGDLFIISAPSGAGKTSLILAVQDLIDNIYVSVSNTTRSIREGEINGVNYNFVTRDFFQKLIDDGKMLEYAEVFGNYYGTPQNEVMQKLEQGIDVILEIDFQGASQIRKVMPNAHSIFILPPSIDVLRSRLTKRATDNNAVIEKRLSKAKEEMSHYVEYDYLLINDDFKRASHDLAAIFTATRLNVQKQQQNISFLAHLFN